MQLLGKLMQEDHKFGASLENLAKTPVSKYSENV